MKKVIIKKPLVFKNQQNTQVSWPLIFSDGDNNDTERIVNIVLSSKYNYALEIDVCDAMLIALTPLCLKNAINICSDMPASEEFFYKYSTIYLPALINNNSGYHNITLNVDTVDYQNYGCSIGTGVSGGIDSSFTILNNLKKPTLHRTITHLVFFDAFLSHRAAIPDPAKRVSNKLNIEIVDIHTDVGKVLSTDGTISIQHYYLFAIMTIRKMFRYYYLASTYSIKDFSVSGYSNSSHPDRIEYLLSNTISIPGFTLYIDGISNVSTRIDKVKYVAENKNFPVTVCTLSSNNCGFCGKCLYTLGAADSIDKLNSFSDSFHIDDYKKMKNKIYGYFKKSYKDPIIKETMDNLVLNKKCSQDIEEVTYDALIQSAIDNGCSGAAAARGFLLFQQKKYPDAKKALLQSIKLETDNYDVYEKIAYIFTLDHDYETAIHYYEIANTMSNGLFATQLFDSMWKSNNPIYDEKMKTLAELSSSNAEMMYRLGLFYYRKTNNNMFAAISWLRFASNSGSIEAKILLFDVLWDVGSNDDEMVMLCNQLISMKIIDGTILLSRLFREGRGVTRNINKSVELLIPIKDVRRTIMLELFDTIFNFDCNEYYDILPNLITNEKYADDPEFIARLGKLYCSNKITPNDCKRGQSLLKKAADEGVSWAQEYITK